jgi:putative SOS response-associated peptidase YedK
MCGRYELHAHPAAIALAFGLAHPPHVRARYNVAPTQDVPIVRRNAQGERELVQMRWGLVPRWAKDPSIGQRMINARGETAATKPAFRNAFRRHRCLVPANGFYEWRQGPDGRKLPLWIGLQDGGLFGFAGLFERWLDPDGHPLDSCTILTTSANALIRRLHDRMPVIVAPEDYERWLDPDDPSPEDLVKPFDAARMTYHPVSTKVNSVRHDDPSCIERMPGGEALLPLEARQPDEAAGDAATGDDASAPDAPAQADLF